MSVEEEVVAVIERYAEGARTADPALVLSTCHESASFRGLFGSEFTVTTPTEYAAVVAANPPCGPEYTHQIHSVSVTGDIASATLDEQGYLGLDFRDLFGLVKIDGDWKIVSKVFTTR